MKKRTTRATERSTADWSAFAERKLRAILRAAREQAGLRKVGPRAGAPRTRPSEWTASVRLVGAPAMTRLNGRYRGKAYPTDVLSFPAPAPFQAQGHLGDLVICLPTLKRQAREQGHAPEQELQVLLIHGVLHLLGLDHELGPRHAAVMQRWEARLLNRSASGLIARSKNGRSKGC